MNKIVIEFDRCKECLYCLTFCPKQIITAGSDINKQGYYPPQVAEPEKCVACATCALVCPEGAISVYREVKGGD